MIKTKRKNTVTCPKCGEKFDIQVIDEKEKVRSNILSELINELKKIAIKKNEIENEARITQFKIDELSESAFEKDKRMILYLEEMLKSLMFEQNQYSQLEEIIKCQVKEIEKNRQKENK